MERVVSGVTCDGSGRSRRQRRRLETGDGLVALSAVVIVAAGALASAPGAFHWSLVPIAACGAVSGTDAVRWLRGKLDTFDPRGLIGLFGVYFFFLAPLFFIASGAELPYVLNPPDWRPWLGVMGLANLLGLGVFRAAERAGRRGTSQVGVRWRMVPGRTYPVLGFGVVLAVGAATYFFQQVGGLGGMATAFFEDPSSLAGLGGPRIVSYALPILTFFVLIIYLRQIGWQGSRAIAIVLIGTTSILQLVVAGASTARGESLTAIVWALIATHYLWRRIGRGTLALAGITMVVFSWGYAYYKALGSKVFDYVRSGASVAELSLDSQRTVSGLLLGDMSRAGIQAYIVWVQQAHPEDFDKRWGWTYLSAIYPLIPYRVWPARPAHAGKVEAGTELLHGRGFYSPTERAFSSHAYGLAGEAMLNFGLAGVPAAFALWGFLVGRFRRYLAAIAQGDLRFLAVPYATYLLVTMPLWDMDNYLAHTLIRAGLPLVLLVAAVARLGRWGAADAGHRPPRPGSAPRTRLAQGLTSVRQGAA